MVIPSLYAFIVLEADGRSQTFPPPADPADGERTGTEVHDSHSSYTTGTCKSHLEKLRQHTLPWNGVGSVVNLIRQTVHPAKGVLVDFDGKGPDLRSKPGDGGGFFGKTFRQRNGLTEDISEQIKRPGAVF